MERPKFLLFGDSITQQAFAEGGWAASMADAYSRRVDVINRGYGGYNTKWALYLMEPIFSRSPESTSSPPVLVTIFFGANDAALPDRPSAKQYVPVNEFTENLVKLVDHIRKQGTQNIILIAPPPVSEAGRMRYHQQNNGVTEATMHPERSNAATGTYAAACREVGASMGLPVVDLWTLMQQEPDWENAMLSDGLHLTPAGNQRLWTFLQETIDLNFKHLSVDALPLDFPHHSEINAGNIAELFGTCSSTS